MERKKAPLALRSQVDTIEEWNAILGRPGLVIVDVYSNWCGPCIAMVSTLSKVKMEIGGDTLSYAVAKNDEIDALERFRGKSEPVWMFIQNGQMVNLIFGANCPKLKKALIEEIRRVKQDEPPEWSLPVTQRGPKEEERWKKKEAIRNLQI
ncbi:thioredoxin domain-containing protein 6-like [Belonocnema kinseyi]|uniref:thioredoxin domain-containing protein 6-like n=1 Tax=Belonocnema kinseyi TaxID=2817044 RepID=UPI00143D014A|nr:thioredoxin domain-containing protein 6-like [Belonocnema kinseyi]